MTEYLKNELSTLAVGVAVGVEVGVAKKATRLYCKRQIKLHNTHWSRSSRRGWFACALTLVSLKRKSNRKLKTKCKLVNEGFQVTPVGGTLV